MQLLEIYLLLLVVFVAISSIATFCFAYMEYKQLRAPKCVLIVGALSVIYPSLCWLIIAWIVGRELKQLRPEQAMLIRAKTYFAVLVLVQMITVNVVVSVLNTPVVDPLYEGELSLVSALFCNVILMCFGLWLNNHLNRLLLVPQTDR